MKRILVVDDSELIRGVLMQFLGDKGFAVETADNGLEGVLAVYRSVPDIVITDVEMPRLQGYQLSRLLKSRREVRKIPIIMHTSLSEDRDRFWASSSGADAFITKDFENLEALAEQVNRLLELAEPPDKSVIAEDAERIDESAALEMLGTLFDRELFQSTILNELGGLDKHIGSLALTAKGLLKLVGKVCEAHIAVLVLQYQDDALIFALPAESVYRQDVEQFQKLCRSGFESAVGPLRGVVQEEVFEIDHRSDYDKTRSDGRRISSYYIAQVKGNGSKTVATLHLGNTSNNYFSETIAANIDVFSAGAGVILENAVLFNTVNEMKRKIHSMFSKFVPAEVIQDLLNQRDDMELKVGEKRELAVLFSDIRSFTVISENNSAEQIVSFLNGYLHRMGQIIRTHGGTIDKFIGDAIVAIFGAPVSYENNAERALSAALEMTTTIPELDTSGLVLPSEGLSVGIGVHEGVVIVGNIGSQEKFDYTVIGDNVNLAARLEGLTKHYHVPILISDTVHQKTGALIPDREVDTVRVKGKDKVTKLFGVVPSGSLTLSTEADRLYRKGLQMYKLSNWTTAIEYFEEVLKQAPDDALSTMYVERCQRFMQEPPPADWGGAIRLDFK